MNGIWQHRRSQGLTGLERSGRMCEFCGDDRCTLTKQQVLERGPILENNACGIMRLETGAGWEEYEINNPLMYQTEQEFVAKRAE